MLLKITTKTKTVFHEPDSLMLDRSDGTITLEYRRGDGKAEVQFFVNEYREAKLFDGAGHEIQRWKGEQ